MVYLLIDVVKSKRRQKKIKKVRITETLSLPNLFKGFGLQLSDIAEQVFSISTLKLKEKNKFIRRVVIIF